jgi:hypothetical protein
LEVIRDDNRKKMRDVQVVYCVKIGIKSLLMGDKGSMGSLVWKTEIGFGKLWKIWINDCKIEWWGREGKKKIEIKEK